ncbi:hypothetical protein F5Y16DRAFT_421018 [Xylariaceae sp. FL0255]|nr:hypothetical protein F5Y16DRAFT_421018 [Xylariaceae sp. FL0255]
MSSSPPNQTQWASSWSCLPGEIRLLILEALMEDSCKLGCFATVSREWQTEIARRNFARIRLTPPRLKEFGPMIYRNRALVHYIWFCLELDDYDCEECVPENWDFKGVMLGFLSSVNDTTGYSIPSAFQTLLSVLSTWEPHANLTLDISIYSPSDSKHWFKYLTFTPDAPSDTFYDPDHGWWASKRPRRPPPELAVIKWNQLPRAPVVTSVLLRQQNRRRWNPQTVAHTLSCFPRLQAIQYEPWREWGRQQKHTDRGFEYLFETIRHLDNSLKRLVVFENFNQQYPYSMRLLDREEDLMCCDNIRKPNPAVSRKIALASLKLEYLAASFIADASQFFETEPHWEWPHLKTLVITSKLLTPDEDPNKIQTMLRAAAAAANKMPRLETMDIWNGRRGVAALSRYQVCRDRQEGRVLWRGTWGLHMEPSVIQAWDTVVSRHGYSSLLVAHESLDGAVINSHADAIHHLILSGNIIRPVSLQQIREEQKALEGARIL